MNIFELAAQNSDALRTKYGKLRSWFENQNHLSSLEGFVEQVNTHRRLGINMRLDKINGMMSSGRHKNRYELAEEEHARQPTKSREQILRERLKRFYEARMAFDRFFDNGERFRYCSLNIGSLGTTYYGEYCVILKQAFLDNCLYLAFIKEDSLKGYILPDSTVNVDRLKAEIADKDHVHILAAVKHQGNLQTTPPEKWDLMVCGGNAYIEAITTQEILVPTVGSVRLNRHIYREHFNNLYRRYSGLTESAQRRVRNFRDLLRSLRRHRIELELIDEN